MDAININSVCNLYDAGTIYNLTLRVVCDKRLYDRGL